MDLQLTLACGDYDRTRPIIDGRVSPRGIALRVVTLPSPERHHRMLVRQEFDVCELSLASYFIARERGMALRAIPVFPHRRFRHGYIFVNRRSRIASPTDLKGKKVGVRRYQNTAAVWVRGILADDYGVSRDSVRWFTEAEEELPVTLPSWLSFQQIPEGSALDALLSTGELDAVIYPETLPSVTRAGPEVVRLFPDYKAVEVDYFRRTGIFPPMHTVVIRAQVLDRYPWVAESLWRAFEQAKLLCYQYWNDQRRSCLAWFGHAWEEQRAILGEDPWPYTLEENRKALETLCRYLLEDGLLRRQPVIDDEFCPLKVTGAGMNG